MYYQPGSAPVFWPEIEHYYGHEWYCGNKIFRIGLSYWECNRVLKFSADLRYSSFCSGRFGHFGIGDAPCR